MSDPQDEFEQFLAEMPQETRSLFAILFGDVKKDHEDGPILEALDALDLPMVMPGDDLYFPPERKPGALLSEDFTCFYDPMGHPLPGDIVAQAQAFEVLRHTPETHFKTDLWSGGTPVWVSTVYLGVNHNFIGPGPPLVWETMIQTNFSWSSWQTRYCTKTAAQQSHSLIVGCLMSLGMTFAEAST